MSRNYLLPVLFVSIILYCVFAPVHGQLRGPKLKIVRTVHGLKEFIDFRVHPSRYILSKTRSYVPAIHDIQENKTKKLVKLDQIPGLPKVPKIYGIDRYQRSKMMIEGRYWRWRTKSIVYYDGARGVAGIVYDKKQKIKKGSDNPICPDGEVSKYVEKYGRYYCYRTRKYIDEKTYLKDVRTQFYAQWDIGSGRISWIAPLERNWNHPMEQEGIQPIGVDPSGRYFYYYNRIFFYGQKTVTPGHILINRFNITRKRVDWRYTIKMPVRRKGSSPPTYGVRFFTSDDLSKIVFWEYDEGRRKGVLRGPTAKGYIVDTNEKNHVSINVPVTPYGQVVTRDNKYVVLGSNQTGFLYKYNSSTGKVLQKTHSGPNIYALLLSKSSKYLYVMNKTSVDVRSWKSLKRIKKIPNNKIFPGITTLLVSEPVLTMSDGRYAIIGVLKKGRRGPWASSDNNDGFHILEIGD